MNDYNHEDDFVPPLRRQPNIRILDPVKAEELQKMIDHLITEQANQFKQGEELSEIVKVNEIKNKS